MDELKKQAEELGIEVDGRWSEKRIQSEIDKALGEDPKPEVSAMTLTNLTANPMKRYGLAAGGSVELTEMQMADEQLMKRIMRGVETGVMSLG